MPAGETIKDVSVAVVGSGFGGSVIAGRLAEAGFRVTLLERGPWRDTTPVRSMGIEHRSPLPRGQALFTRLLRGIGGNRLFGGSVSLSNKGLFELFLGEGTTIACSSGVGGGSHVYSAVNIRPLAENFWEGHAEGVSDASMSPHYDAVLERMGSVTPMADHRIPNTSRVRFAGAPALEPAAPPPDPRIGYLLPEDPDNPKLVTDANGVERWEVDYHANEDGFLGSPGGGKTTLEVVYLAPALKRGLTVQALAEVETVADLRTREGPIYEITFHDHQAGERRTLRAQHVVMAAGTLNTLRILLRSRAEGLLDGMPQLGKRFGTNGDFFGYWDYNDASVDQSTGLPTTGGVRLKGDRSSPMIGGGGLPSVDSYPLPQWAKARLKRAYMIAGLGEDTLNGQASYERGKLKVRYSPDESPILGRLRATFDAISRRTGHRIHVPKTPITVHPLGGACLGKTRETGVVDANGEVFDHPGLYVTDAAALPRSPGGPPSMTIAAWANHVASRFIERYG